MGNQKSVRNRLLDRFHTKYKFRGISDYQHDKQLLHDLYDQYHRAMRLLDEQKIEEDQDREKQLKRSKT